MAYRVYLQCTYHHYLSKLVLFLYKLSMTPNNKVNSSAKKQTLPLNSPKQPLQSASVLALDSLSSSEYSLKTLHERKRFHQVRFRIIASICIILLIVCLRSLFFTTMYFHTPVENIVAMSLVYVTIGVSAFYALGTSYWTAMLKTM